MRLEEKSMSLQEEYDEKYDIVDTLDSLIDRITDEDYKMQLEETKYQAQDRMQEIEPILQKEQWEEERAEEQQYWASAV